LGWQDSHNTNAAATLLALPWPHSFWKYPSKTAFLAVLPFVAAL